MPVFQFDDIKVDTQTFRVYKAGQPAPMEPKAFEVLVYLIENRGRLVEKKELLDSLWKETFVTENALTREVAVLRKALAEDAKNTRYIETVPTKGYRFIADVQEIADGSGVANSRTRAVPKGDATGRHSLRILGVLAGVVLLAIAPFLVVSLRWSTSSEFEIINNAQITTAGGLSMFPSISPDGSSVVYASDRGGTFEIYARQLNPGGGEIQLTNDGKQNFEPAWSPDGKFIAYACRGRGGLWLIPALGGTPRQLVDFGSRPAWSPDAHRIAFESDRAGAFDADSPDAFPPSVLWVLNVETGEYHQLTQLGHPTGGHGAPSWSPDGKRIAFTSSAFRSAEIWSVAADGSDLRLLMPGGHTYYNSPVFFRDGHSILFGAVKDKFNYGIWKLALSSSNTPEGAPVQVASGGASRVKNLSLSSNGKHLLYTAITQNSNLNSVSVDAAGAAAPPRSLTNSMGCRNTLPAFSPDGQWIAYMSCRAGYNGALWLMRSDGSGIRQLTARDADDGLPSWFPDNDKIAFSSESNSYAMIWSVSANTGRQELLFDPHQSIGFFRLSPDGTKIAFDSSGGGRLQVFIADLSDKTIHPLTSVSVSLGFPSWSLDGKWIGLELQQAGDTQLGYMPSKGGPFTQLTFDHGESWTGGWAPDNDHISFAGRRDGIWNVYSISCSTRKTTQITNYSKHNSFVRYPVWAPNGNQIVYEYTETSGNIWMLDFK